MAVSFTAGQKVRALDLLQFPLGVVARNLQIANVATTASTAGTAQRVLTTGGSVTAGRLYRVTLRGHMRCSAVDATGEINLRYTTDGTEPTAASTTLSGFNVELGTVDVGEQFFESVLYAPATSHTFTVTAAMHRPIGAGTLTASSNAPGIELVIEDRGEAVAVSGALY